MNSLLEVQSLVVEFAARHGPQPAVRAVDGVSFSLAAGEVLALVGESGSGKSTTARAITRLIEPRSGAIRLKGEDVLRASRTRLRYLRRHMALVFQDPYASLNPYMIVEDIVAEGLDIHGLARSRHVRRDRVVEMLELAGLGAEHLRRRPAEFSGGERQRIAIARAMAIGPELLICDEPVSSLDSSIRAQILNLFMGLRGRGLAFLFISHDLATVRHIADRVAVMQAGRIVEEGEASAMFTAPKHEYTRSLVLATPVPDPSAERRRRGTRRARP